MGRTVKAVTDNCSTNYFYDDLGRVYEEISSDSFKAYSYEGVSQYVECERAGIFHKIIYYEKTYEYDDEMRVSSVRESKNDIVSYTYDSNGNKKSETLGNGVVSIYTYNNANRITKLENKSGDVTISIYEYSYYLDGSDACKLRNENGIIETTEYEYDGLKRLTEESIKVGNNTTDTYKYEYDDYSNRSKMTATGSEDYVTEYSYVDSNGKYTALLQKETKTVQDGNNSNVKQTVYTYDANGNQITKTADGKTETNTYDGLNQLIGFTDGETTASYTYDVNGLRLSKTVNGSKTTHIWIGNQIAVDYTGSYTSTVYLRGTSLAAAFNWNEGYKGDYRFYTQNAHGDVVSFTDSTGAVVKSYTYDTFGVEKNIDENDTNPFRYCGEYFDAETGTIYLRARYYSPTIGRFISRDSVAGKNEDPLSLNLYTYCHNNPLYNFDPSGHSIWSELVDCYETGIDMLKDGCWGNGGKYFASYSEGVVDTLCDYGEGVDKFLDHPIQTTCDSVGQLITDPTKPVRNVGTFYCNLASASYNHDWNSVAYSLGGATTHTAVIGSTYTAFSSIPKSVTVPKLNYSAYALSNGQAAYAFSVSAACVSTAGAVSIGKATVGVNIMYAKPSKKSGKERATDIPSWAKGEKPLDGEGGKDFAKRLCDEKYGPGNYKTGPGSDYSKLKKNGDRGH